MEGKENCDNCGAMLFGEKIPENDRQSFGGRVYFRREVAIYDREKDRTIAYRCPDCCFEWDANE